MRALQLLLLLFPFLLSAQKGQSVTKDETIRGFSRAITEYLQALPKQDRLLLDTLFVGKHEEFPDITLASRIHQTPIVLLSSEQADKKLSYRTSLLYVNIIGDVTKELSHFLFVTFLVLKPDKNEQYLPQHNCSIDLESNQVKKEMPLTKLQFDYPYPTRSH